MWRSFLAKDDGLILGNKQQQPPKRKAEAPSPSPPPVVALSGPPPRAVYIHKAALALSPVIPIPKFQQSTIAPAVQIFLPNVVGSYASPIEATEAEKSGVTVSELDQLERKMQSNVVFPDQQTTQHNTNIPHTAFFSDVDVPQKEASLEEPAFLSEVPKSPCHAVVTSVVEEEDDYADMPPGSLAKEPPSLTIMTDANTTVSGPLLDKFTSPAKYHRFDFLSDAQVPLPVLEEQSTKRRHEFNTRIYELECKVASLTCQLMNEHMDLDLSLFNHASIHTCQPLHRLMERMHSRLLQSPAQSQLQSVMRRLRTLESKHAQHVHVDLVDARRDELQSAMQELTHNTMPSVQLECHKADKREGSLMRRFESMAGTAARRYQEESSARKAGLVYLQSLLDNQGDMDEQRAKEFLRVIQGLREQVTVEQENRKMHDKTVSKDVEMGSAAMRRALLEAADDSHSGF
jgi:hypothetical protein